MTKAVEALPVHGSGPRDRLRREAAALAAAVLALLLGACQSRATPASAAATSEEAASRPEGPLPPSLEPVVIPNPRGGGRGDGPVRDARPIGEEDAGWAEKYELASGYLAGGFEDEALAVIRAAVALEPPPPWEERFARLRTTLRVRQLETGRLRLDARGERDYVVFGEDVDWRVRVRNVSGEELVFPAPGAGPGRPSPSAVSLVVHRRDVDIYGAELHRTWNDTLYLQRPDGEDVRIPPRSGRELPAKIPAADLGGPISGLKVLVLTGTLRGTVRVGKAGEEGLALDIRPGRVVVVPPGYEPLARAPLESLRAAVEAVAPTHLLIATEFVPRRDAGEAIEILTSALADGDVALHTAALGALSLLRDRCAGRTVSPLLDPLVEALDRRPARADALMRALARMTGQSIAPDARLWRDWWRRAVQRGTAIPPSQGAPRALAEGEAR